MMKFAPYFKEGQIIVNVAKGIEDGSLKTLAEVIKECAPMCEVAVLSGPSPCGRSRQGDTDGCRNSFS